MDSATDLSQQSAPGSSPQPPATPTENAATHDSHPPVSDVHLSHAQLDTRGSRFHVTSTALVVLFALCIVIGGVLAYDYTIDLRTPPLERLLNAVGAVNTFTLDQTGEFSVVVAAPTREDQGIGTAFGSSSMRVSWKSHTIGDVSDLAHTRSRSDLDGTYVVGSQGMTLSDTASLSLVHDGDIALYVTVRSMPQILALLGFGPLTGRPIRIDMRTLGTYAAFDSARMKNGSESNKDSVIRNTLVDADGEVRTARAAALTQLRTMLIANPPVRFGTSKKASHTTRSGQEISVRKYPLTFDPLHTRVFLQAYLAQLEQLPGGLQDTEDRADREALLDAAIQGFTLNHAEMWLGTTDNLPYRLIIDATLAISEDEARELAHRTNDPTEPDGTAAFTYHFLLDQEWYDFNTPVVMEYPKQAVPLETVLQELVTQSEAKEPEYESASVVDATSTPEQVATTTPDMVEQLEGSDIHASSSPVSGVTPATVVANVLAPLRTLLGW